MAWDIQAPYVAGTPDPIFAGGDADAGGRDDVAGDVAGAVASAEARFREHESDTYALGSTIGDLMHLTPVDSADQPPVYGPFSDQQPPSGSYI